MSKERIDSPDENMNDAVDLSFKKLGDMFDGDPDAVRNIRRCQTNLLKYWSETCDAVEKCMWFPIFPRKEMSTEQAILAMITIFEE